MRLAEPLGFSVVEMLLLAALVIASLGMFAYRLWVLAPAPERLRTGNRGFGQRLGVGHLDKRI